MFRLGGGLVVRLPRYPGAVGDVEHELRWLPELGPRLPLDTPRPVGRGEPGAGFPFPCPRGTCCWALSISLIQLPYYWDTNPPLAASSRHVIREMPAERG
ncbi:hypothetical protein SSP24_31320 [Streptomyces spinoverrucosus]|uniref:Uncharacterized protein n=1 Tax=Streptomyces spinoverrucosus TaxID=284043 RepID=A0A4Y3VEY2_9ACTN|nr:hypothetical protein [Streptomyces spinoverrucosus]GEC05477.1 hypothetical protein SSP24_31320 [Streptomyces spinoverrucosus]GHB93203.1 hypothetical protein GCM10010397_77430 [Streptomyces spinoverrucosus]